MFDFPGSPVPVRQDLKAAYVNLWEHLSEPGPTLSASQRVGLAEYVRAARSGGIRPQLEYPTPLLNLAAALFTDPGAVNRTMVRSASEAVGDPMVVETISIVSMLSAVDGTHRALTAVLEPLPVPLDGDPTGDIATGLRERRTHVPMPAGPIPVALDLLPGVGRVFQDSFGPQYMTGMEMSSDAFRRDPGLNRAQMELVSSRVSIHNECFY